MISHATNEEIGNNEQTSIQTLQGGCKFQSQPGQFVLEVVEFLSVLFCNVYFLFWWRGTVVECRSLAGELSLSCARPAADG